MNLQELDRALGAKCDLLRAAESAAEWRFRQGEVADGHLPTHDDGDWPTVPVPTTWAGAAGDAWFRREFSFPDVVEGIPTAGARVELPLLLAIHSTVYVDGVERVAETSWLDSRAVPLVLCDSYRPGQVLQVAIHAFQGDGFGLLSVDHAEVSVLEDQVFRLGVVRNQIGFAHHLAYESDQANLDWQSTWMEAAGLLDLRALGESRWDTWWGSVEAALAALSPLATAAKSHTTFMAGHSHIDMNWLWTWDETLEVIRRDFAAADLLMERYPDFRFSHSQASTYQAMGDHYPELLDRVKRRVAQGNWEVTASTWVEGDLNLQCGESLVRHLLLTRPYIAGLFGLRPRICWEPDTFGHVATLPQLLKQAGVDYYYFCRAGRGQPLFWWEGLDGSRVLAFNDPLGYNGVVEPDGAVAPVLDLARRHGLKQGLYLYGVGDHGGGATARDIERARVLDGAPLLPRVRMSDLVSFYDAARASSADLPVIHGELNTTFEGCYTSHSDIKLGNRRCENGLLTAETLATIATALAGAPYPDQELTESWRTLLFHHFHDIICGCAIGATYKEAAEKLGPVIEAAEAIAGEAAESLTEQVDTGDGHDARCAVWNPLAWSRTDLVSLPIEAFGEVPGALMDDTGQVTPVQAAGDRLLFIAADVPALGCRVYRPTDRAATTDLVAGDDATLENSILRLQVHPDSGAIDRMIDLENSRYIDSLSVWRGVERKKNAGMINRLQVLWEEPHPMSAWNIGDITRVENLLDGAQVEVIERGPVRATVTARRRVLHSTIVQRYRLYRGLRRVDIETELDWHERGGKDVDAPMLWAIFKPLLGRCVATFEVAFAGLERTPTGDEVPALRWADVSDGSYGLSLLNNGKYGHQAHGTTLGLTLVRSPYEPDNLPDQGHQSFAYALYPHRGGWREASTDRRAAEFNQPLVPTLSGSHGGPLVPGQPLLTCEPASVMVTAVKRAQSGEEAIIVRLVEMHGRQAQARLRWGWTVQSATEVNLLEEHLREIPCRPDGCELAMGRHKVVTLKLTLA